VGDGARILDKGGNPPLTHRDRREGPGVARGGGSTCILSGLCVSVVRNEANPGLGGVTLTPGSKESYRRNRGLGQRKNEPNGPRGLVTRPQVNREKRLAAWLRAGRGMRNEAN